MALELSKGCEAHFRDGVEEPGVYFCRVSTVDSDILASCDMKDELA